MHNRNYRNDRSLTVGTLSLLIFGCGLAPALGDNWPHFRGPHYNGVSVDSTLAASRTTEVWSTVVHNGCASMTFVDGKLFTMGNQEGKEYVFCLDASTGKEIWRFAYNCDLAPRLYDGGPNATPTVEQGRVYTLSRQGHIFCLDAATGKQYWEASARELTPKGGWWGFSGSPTIVGDLVLLNVGQSGLALAKDTGQPVWGGKTPEKAYATVLPLPESLLGVPAAVVRTTSGIHIVDPTTGKALLDQDEAWRIRKSNCNGVSPVCYQGSLYVMHGKQGLSKLSVSGSRWTEDWLCEKAKYSNDWFAFNQPVFHEGYCFAIVGEARRKCRMVCVDIHTGQLAWEQPADFGNLILVGHTLVSLSQNGELAWGSLKGSKYTVQHQSKPLSGGRSGRDVYWPYPVILDGHLYARTTKGNLTCLKFE